MTQHQRTTDFWAYELPAEVLYYLLQVRATVISLQNRDTKKAADAPRFDTPAFLAAILSPPNSYSHRTVTTTQDDCRPGGQIRVLLADDSPVQQKLASIMLRKQGHTVKLASTGKDAVEAWENEHFDLVLMDIEMPVMNGLDATSIIREREGKTGRHTPVVAVTSTTDQERCFAVGMDAFIAKPLMPNVLNATMKQVLGI